MWLNDGTGQFTDASTASGVAAILAGLDTYSVAAGDFDADGDLDVHITTHPTDKLLVNQGGGVFVDGTATAELGGPPSSASAAGSSKIAAWGDFDGDRDLDLAVVSSTFDNHPPHIYVMSNEGDGTFTDVTATTGAAISTAGNPCALMWTDYDNDGDLDLAVWNDRGNSSTNRTMLRNDAGTFTDVTLDIGWNNPMGNPMGIDSADLDGDGRNDYYIAGIGNNALLMNLGNDTFADFGLSAGVRGDFGWGLVFEDFDTDGFWDIFVAQEDDLAYLSFHNDQANPGPEFTRQDWTHGVVGNGHNVALAAADMDGDGDVDIVTGGTSGSRMNLFRNDSIRTGTHWLHVVIDEEPVTGAAGGIGARVVVETPGGTWFRDIKGGNSRASQQSLGARFGLGPWDGATTVAVLWPDGRSMAVRNVPGDQVLHLP